MKARLEKRKRVDKLLFQCYYRSHAFLLSYHIICLYWGFGAIMASNHSLFLAFQGSRQRNFGFFLSFISSTYTLFYPAETLAPSHLKLVMTKSYWKQRGLSSTSLKLFVFSMSWLLLINWIFHVLYLWFRYVQEEWVGSDCYGRGTPIFSYQKDILHIRTLGLTLQVSVVSIPIRKKNKDI